MIATIRNIVFVKFTFNAVCAVDEFFVCDFTLINIAILNANYKYCSLTRCQNRKNNIHIKK